MSEQDAPLPSDTFCILPWIHLSTRPDGSMRVCCTANASSVGATNDKEHGGRVGVLKTEDGKPANLNNSDLDSAWNNTYMRSIRQMMIAGEKPASCLKCYKEEAAGHRSKRQWETQYWIDNGIDPNQLIQDTYEDGSTNANLVYIDIRMGTKCQLGCVMCSPHDSSGWVKDFQKIYPKIENPTLKQTMVWENKGREFGASYNWHKDNPMFWNQFYAQIPNMRQLYFAGGESTVIAEHYEILDKVIEMGYASEMEVRYNSNGIEIPDRLLEQWKHFKKVRFHYSVDSIGKMNDYIRYPSEWSHNLKQFELLDTRTSNNVEITIACAVNALNIYYIPDFLRWKLQESGLKKTNMWPFGAGGINYHFVYWPGHLNVKMLPREFLDKCEEHYEEFIEWWKENWELGIPSWHKGKVTYEQWENANYGIKRLRGMINFARSEDWTRRLPEFREYITKLDEQRGTDFRATFPEMAYLLDED
tara:strand:+ start:2798 stop:4219 length:1422 start_codon:yes stop_codon:yes gene_type:complete